MLKALLVVAAVLAPSVADAEIISKKNLASSSGAKLAAPQHGFSVETMLDKIQRSYMTGLRRCYNKGLALDANLRGTVTVTFTVSPYGHVSGDASGISPKVDSCVTTQLAKWRFGSPSNRREATFRLNLVLAQ